jgi:thymidine kinase
MSLHLILGPMFSGKTTSLIRVYNQCIEEGKTVAVINFSGDTRYHATMLSTHDQVMIPCISASTISEVWTSQVNLEIHTADVILINEGQFFPDIVDVVGSMVEEFGKTVYICGLDGDFRRQKFGTVLNLLPLCDSVTKLSAKCHLCIQPAIFSHRLTAEQEQVVIGSNNYIPLCRPCYRRMNVHL